MEWSDLWMLLAFHEEGTLEGVARLRGVRASTVSRRLRTLEASLGVRLVENLSGRLVLTTAGEHAASTAEKMRVHSDELLRKIAGKDQQISGVIRVGLLEVFVRFHADAFVSFSNAHPEVELQLLVQGSLLHSLTQREADVVLRATQSPIETLIGKPVLNLHYAPFIHPSLATSSFKPDKLKWIGWHEALGAIQTEAWLRQSAGAENIIARVTTTASMIDLALAQIGACLIPVRYGKAAGLHQLAPPLENFDSEVWMLTHRDLAGGAKVRALMRHLTQHFKRLAT